jgi:hypothetical protein
MEEDIFSKIQSNSIPKEGETCNRFETSNLHNNDKFIETVNDFKFQIQQLIVATEQNITAISNLESICQTPQSSSDTHIHLGNHAHLGKNMNLSVLKMLILRKKTLNTLNA